MGMATHDIGEAMHPRFVGMGVHPLDAAFDRRMVHDDIGRLGRIAREFGVEPCGARGAKGAAVAPFLQRVDRDEPHVGQVDRILHEAVAVVEARKLRVKIVAQIMVAHARPDRKGTARKGGGEPAIAVGIAAIGDIAGREQQVGPVRPLDEHVEHIVEPLAVIFGRIVRIEPDMDIGDLGDQHIRPLLGRWRPSISHPPRLAPCKEGVRHVTS